MKDQSRKCQQDRKKEWFIHELHRKEEAGARPVESDTCVETLYINLSFIDPSQGFASSSRPSAVLSEGWGRGTSYHPTGDSLYCECTVGYRHPVE